MKQQQQTPIFDGTPCHNSGQSRYELAIDGQVAAFANYRADGQSVCFTHTEVQPQYEGQGLASRLAQYALDDVRARGLKAVPQCRFVAQYIARHEKDYGDLLAD